MLRSNSRSPGSHVVTLFFLLFFSMQKRDFFTFFEQSQTFSRTLPPACCTALQVISARFDELALEATYRCLFDSVTLYDGRSRTAPKLGSFCNDEVLSVTSTGPSMSVVFMSDGSGNTGGFSLSWTIVDNCSSGWRLFCFRVSEKKYNHGTCCSRFVSLSTI